MDAEHSIVVAYIDAMKDKGSKVKTLCRICARTLGRAPYLDSTTKGDGEMRTGRREDQSLRRALEGKVIQRLTGPKVGQNNLAVDVDR